MKTEENIIVEKKVKDPRSAYASIVGYMYQFEVALYHTLLDGLNEYPFPLNENKTNGTFKIENIEDYSRTQNDGSTTYVQIKHHFITQGPSEYTEPILKMFIEYMKLLKGDYQFILFYNDASPVANKKQLKIKAYAKIDEYHNKINNIYEQIETLNLTILEDIKGILSKITDPIILWTDKKLYFEQLKEKLNKNYSILGIEELYNLLKNNDYFNKFDVSKYSETIKSDFIFDYFPKTEYEKISYTSLITKIKDTFRRIYTEANDIELELAHSISLEYIINSYIKTSERFAFSFQDLKSHIDNTYKIEDSQHYKKLIIAKLIQKIETIRERYLNAVEKVYEQDPDKQISQTKRYKFLFKKLETFIIENFEQDEKRKSFINSIISEDITPYKQNTQEEYELFYDHNINAHIEKYLLKITKFIDYFENGIEIEENKEFAIENHINPTSQGWTIRTNREIKEGVLIEKPIDETQTVTFADKLVQRFIGNKFLPEYWFFKKIGNNISKHGNQSFNYDLKVTKPISKAKDSFKSDIIFTKPLKGREFRIECLGCYPDSFDDKDYFEFGTIENIFKEGCQK